MRANFIDAPWQFCLKIHQHQHNITNRVIQAKYGAKFLTYPVTHVEVDGCALFGAVGKTTEGLPIVSVHFGLHVNTLLTGDVHVALFAALFRRPFVLGVKFDNGMFHVDGTGCGEAHRAR